jgi:serine/threonine protein kinase
MPILKQFGQNRIEAELGGGQWTETYHATDIVHRRPVALKLLRPNLLPSERIYWELIDSAQRASELVHPHIAWMWETGNLEGRFYLTERFMGGRSLAALLTSNGPLPWNEAIQRIEEVAQAIEFARQRGWRHARLTPHNILISHELGAGLSDYGLWHAIMTLQPEFPISIYDAQYLSPEILQGKPLSIQSDVYSLACVVQEMLSGLPAFTGASLEEIKARKIAPIEHPLLPPEIAPIQASELIEQVLKPGSSTNYKSTLDFVQLFAQAIQQGLTDESARLRHEEQLRRWRESEEQTRRQAEETARQAALEQARREIHELAHQEAEQIILLQEEPEIQELIERQPGSSSISRRSERRRSTWRRFFPLLVLAAVAVLGFAGYWLWGNISIVTGLESSQTPTSLPISPTIPALPTNTLGINTVNTAIPSVDPKPSQTTTPSATPSSKPSPTIEVSVTPSPSGTLFPSTTADINERLEKIRRSVGQ